MTYKTMEIVRVQAYSVALEKALTEAGVCFRCFSQLFCSLFRWVLLFSFTVSLFFTVLCSLFRCISLFSLTVSLFFSLSSGGDPSTVKVEKSACGPSFV